MRPCAIVVLALALASCSKKTSPSSLADGGEVSASAPKSSPKRLATTSWSIAGGNVNGDIAERLRLDRPDAASRAQLVGLLLGRGQTLAKIADYEKAEEIARKSVAANPTNADAHLSHARVLSTFHRFDEATKELDEAERLGGNKERIASARAGIALALGRYDDAKKLYPPEPREPTEIATRAALAGRMLDHANAERLFDEARSAIVDVSPFPVAWIAFQRASWYESRGDEARARASYEEALDAIPVYAHAAVHLSFMEAPDRAIARLEPLRSTSDDPEVLAALVDAHRRAKHDADAKRFTAEAKDAYAALVAKHHAAFADHAARFLLREGDAPKALALAKDNAKLRATEEAIDLLMGAAAAANDKQEICASAAAMNALAYVTPERKRAAAAALRGCP